jgi:hypothetical protein
MKMCTEFWSENQKGRDESEDLDDDNIKLDLREVGWEDVDWMHLDQDTGQWRGLVNTVMNLRIPQKAGNFLTGYFLTE